jgi:phage recombination protein Bet
MADQRRPYSSQQRPGQQQTKQASQQASSSGPTVAGAGNQAPAVRKPMGKQKLFEKFAHKFGIDEDLLIETLKATCFRGQKPDAPPITNEQLVMLLIVADQYGLNPFTKEIYAYPDKGGIVAVVSIDGWIRIIQEHPQFNGMQINVPDEMVTDKSERKHKHKPCWEWMECTIFRKDREHNLPVVEYFEEVYRQSINAKGSDGWYEIATPWQSHTKRMMRHKTMIQAGRVTFGFAGIYDDDEAQRILDDDLVVATVPPGEASKTHTDAARTALQRKLQPHVPAEEKKEPERAAAAPAHKEARKEMPPASERREPWDDVAEGIDDADGSPQTPEEWQQALAGAPNAKALEDVMGAYIDFADKAGLAELDIEVEAKYQYLKEKFQEQTNG